MSLTTPTSARPPDELTEFAMDILGRSAVQLRLPCQHVAVTLEHLRKLRMVTERAILILEAAPTKDDRTALFQVGPVTAKLCRMAICDRSQVHQ